MRRENLTEALLFDIMMLHVFFSDPVVLWLNEMDNTFPMVAIAKKPGEK